MTTSAPQADPQQHDQLHDHLTPEVLRSGDDGKPDDRFIKATGPLRGDDPLLADVPQPAGDLRDLLREAALRAMI